MTVGSAAPARDGGGCATRTATSVTAAAAVQRTACPPPSRHLFREEAPPPPPLDPLVAALPLPFQACHTPVPLLLRACARPPFPRPAPPSPAPPQVRRPHRRAPPPPPVARAAGTLFTAVSHIFCAVVGAGVLGLPNSLAWVRSLAAAPPPPSCCRRACRRRCRCAHPRPPRCRSCVQLGWIAGPICLLAFFVISLWSAHLMAQLYLVDGIEFSRYHHAVSHVLVGGWVGVGERLVGRGAVRGGTCAPAAAASGLLTPRRSATAFSTSVGPQRRQCLPARQSVAAHAVTPAAPLPAAGSWQRDCNRHLPAGQPGAFVHWCGRRRGGQLGGGGAWVPGRQQRVCGGQRTSEERCPPAAEGLLQAPARPSTSIPSPISINCSLQHHGRHCHGHRSQVPGQRAQRNVAACAADGRD